MSKDYCKFSVKPLDPTLEEDLTLIVPLGSFYISVENIQYLLHIQNGVTYQMDETDFLEIEAMLQVGEDYKTSKIQDTLDPKKK